MQKINFQNLPGTTTPVNATNLNALQSNVEDVFNGSEVAGNMVVESIKTKNMFDKNSMVYTRNGYLPFDTSNTRLANFGGVGPATLVIKLEAGKTYTMSKIAGARFRAGFTNTPTPPLDTDNVITRIPNNDTGTSMTFTVPSGNVYFVCNFFSQDQTVDANIGYGNMLNTIQIEEGTTATTYSPYQELDNQETYLTTEQEIGIWIDGKTLYRRCFEIPQTTISSSSTTAISIPTGNINMVDIRGYVYVGTSQYRYSITGFRNLDYGVRNQSGGTQLLVGTTLAAEGTIRGVAIIDYTKN